MPAPIKKFRVGKVECAIFQNEINKRITYSFKFQKSYKTKEGDWKNTDNFYGTDLRDLYILVNAMCLRQVKENTPKPVSEPEPESRDDLPF